MLLFKSPIFGWRLAPFPNKPGSKMLYDGGCYFISGQRKRSFVSQSSCGEYKNSWNIAERGILSWVCFSSRNLTTSNSSIKLLWTEDYDNVRTLLSKILATISWFFLMLCILVVFWFSDVCSCVELAVVHCRTRLQGLQKVTAMN